MIFLVLVRVWVVVGARILEGIERRSSIIHAQAVKSNRTET